MAYDKVVDSGVLNAGLTKIANAIRAKGGTSGQLAFPDGLAAAIAAIQAGGGDISVYVGEDEPEDPLPGTLWVMTNDVNPDGSYVFSLYPPGEADTRVWFPVAQFQDFLPFPAAYMPVGVGFAKATTYMFSKDGDWVEVADINTQSTLAELDEAYQAGVNSL